MANQVIPKHVAIIPDGNRRWAKEKGKKSSYGHEKGAEIFQDVTRYASDKNIKYLSIWGMSLSNLRKRSLQEVNTLFNIFQDQFESLTKSEDIHSKKIRINVIGSWRQKFPSSLVKTIDKAIEATKDYNEFNLTFFLAYNGTDEMIKAIQSIVNLKIDNLKVTSSLIKEHLLTRDLPPVDLLIRTGGEPHLSTGFMMWDTADSELYFTLKYWPEFTNQEFELAIQDYSLRRRQKGK